MINQLQLKTFLVRKRFGEDQTLGGGVSMS